MTQGFMSSMLFTSASGRTSVFRRVSTMRAGALTFCLMFGGMSTPSTASTYQIQIPSERTSSGPARPVFDHPTDTAASAMLEIRRKAGLTWDELAELFGVSRRSVHHWANGNTVNSKNEQAIRQTLALVRRFDRGASSDTKALLLTLGSDGLTVLDLLRAGRFKDAVARAPSQLNAPIARVPLSKKELEARRSPSPGLLVDAIQDRPELPPAKARIARALRVPKATS